MKKILKLALLLLIIPSICFAETIVLKSGKVVEGKIIERTDKYIKIDIQGIPLTYFLDEIDNIKLEIPKPPFKTIKISYKIIQKILDDKGNTASENIGEQIRYIDVSSNKSRIEEKITSTFGNFQNKQEILQIFDGEKSYSIDLAKNEAIYSEMPTENIQVWNDLLPSYENEKFLIGTDNLLSRECKVYNFASGKTWLWNGIILKQERNDKNTYSLTEAKNIEENIKIDNDKFELPKGISKKSIGSLIAESIKGATSITETQKKIESLKEITYTDLAQAIINPDAEQKIINAIKADSTMSEKEKQEALMNFQQMLIEQRKLVDKARTKEGKIDVGKLEEISLGERVKANDLFAQATIRTIMTAIESYRAVNNGMYPEKEEVLLNSNPPCLLRSYNNKNYEGYIFSLELRADGYKIIATPEECGRTGNKIFIARSLQDIRPTAEDLKNKTPEEIKNFMKAYAERETFKLTEKDCKEP